MYKLKGINISISELRFKFPVYILKANPPAIIPFNLFSFLKNGLGRYYTVIFWNILKIFAENFFKILQKTVILGITRAKKGVTEKYFVSFCPKMWFEIAIFRNAAISNFIFWVAKFQKYFDSIKVIIVVYNTRYFHAFIQMKFWLLFRYDLSNNMHVENFFLKMVGFHSNSMILVVLEPANVNLFVEFLFWNISRYFWAFRRTQRPSWMI